MPQNIKKKICFSNFHFSGIRNSVRSGVTLIELALVALFMGMILLSLFGVYLVAVKIQSESQPSNGVTRTQIMQAVENIRASITRTYFFESQRRLLFIGKNVSGEGDTNTRSDRLVFSAAHPNSEEMGSPSVREVSFYLKKMNNGKDEFYLIRREDDMVDEYPLTGGVEHVLLENVRSFQLKYSERGDKWLEEWNSKLNKKIPKLVRIEIVALVGNQYLRYESLAHPGIHFK